MKAPTQPLLKMRIKYQKQITLKSHNLVIYAEQSQKRIITWNKLNKQHKNTQKVALGLEG